MIYCNEGDQQSHIRFFCPIELIYEYEFIYASYYSDCIKAIAVCEGFEECNYKEIYNGSFLEKYTELSQPLHLEYYSGVNLRDIVRLLPTQKRNFRITAKGLSQAVFNSLSKAYSEESLSEIIKEELRAFIYASY